MRLNLALCNNLAYISNNIRLILDILDYSDLILSDSFIFLLDYYKAFDTLEHEKLALEMFSVKWLKCYM